MNRRLLLVIAIILLLIAGVLIIRTQQFGDYKIRENSVIQPKKLILEDCVAKEAQNLKNNEYFLASELSVVFYTKPSADLINSLAKKYNLEIIQIYNDPNVIFRVKKEDIPTVKCQLQNESEIEKVVFIESRPLPAK